MMEVKLFWVSSPTRPQTFGGHESGGNATGFEAEINTWLAENPDINIAHVEQSACGGSWGPSLWLVSVWFTRKPGS